MLGIRVFFCFFHRFIIVCILFSHWDILWALQTRKIAWTFNGCLAIITVYYKWMNIKRVHRRIEMKRCISTTSDQSYTSVQLNYSKRYRQAIPIKLSIATSSTLFRLSVFRHRMFGAKRKINAHGRVWLAIPGDLWMLSAYKTRYAWHLG